MESFEYYCELTKIPFQYYFDFSYAPNLLFYAYIPVAAIALFLGFYIFFKENFSLRAKLFFLITVLFAISIINEIILWTAVPAYVIYFGWAMVPLLRLGIIISTFYFVYLFLNKNLISFKYTAIIFLFSLPVIFLLPTNLNISSFDVGVCEAINGPLVSYVYFLATLVITFFIFLIVKLSISHLKDRHSEKLEQIILLTGSVFFLIFLSFSEFIAVLSGDYEVNLIGPVGMLIFISILAYMIVKFKTFNIKLIGAQALVVSLWFLVGSLMFVAVSNTTRITAGVTLLFTTIAGYFLVKSVKREVALREKIEGLVVDLDKANERLKILDKMKSEFVSIASHQLRSPLTSIRGYASMLAEGSYGTIPEKAREALVNIVDSAKFMALSVEDYLNVSRIEAGNMKYELSDFNLKDVAEKIVDEMRPTAMKKGLVMMFRSDCNGSCSINADIGKTRQIIMNLLDNSMKYTPKGTITVVAHDDVKAKKMYITIQDTGVGMSKETQSEVFDKFVRAKNANSVNVTGTGLGLFVAKKMVNEMNGKVWAESEGEGMGSKFHIEFPLLPGKSTH